MRLFFKVVIFGLMVGMTSAHAVVDEKASEVPFITDERLYTSDQGSEHWLAIGRDYKEQFFSPLDKINADNVKHLGLEWTFELDTNRGQQAAPLIADGKMYFSTAWSKVKALDAITGKLIWEYDPKVDPVKATQACCDAVNRGIALWQDRLFVATLDGRLVALSLASGEPIWDVITIPENSLYTSTGAPRVANGKVFIGNGGAEYGARGYVTAYDADNGKQLWRFYTVPGDPAKPQENPILEDAKQTWGGEWWKFGGGGTVWDAIVYDAELDQLYIGVGNGGPHNPVVRSPGGGDNLFVGSIVALNPDNGEYLWHFQATPGDAWDFTSTQPIILADLNINGQLRKVLMQAPKNGFFYVIDRTSGEFISGEAYAEVNWAKGLDKNGRPILNPEALYYKTGKPFLTRPGPAGAHSWQPMAFNPETGLVYIPVMESPFISMGSYQMEGGSHAKVNELKRDDPALVKTLATMRETIKSDLDGYLLAWDPVQQKAKWRAQRAKAFNGGVLTTGGNLVFQGDANGEFAAYNAQTGAPLWQYDTYGGIVAAPSTFSVNGEQYVSVIQGWGGGFALLAGDLAQLSGPKRNISRVLTFKLGGKEILSKPTPTSHIMPPPFEGSTDSVEQGKLLYAQNCRRCHGPNVISGGTVPDLRRSPMLHSLAGFEAVVTGALLPRGMPSFKSQFSKKDIVALRHYILSEANRAD